MNVTILVSNLTVKVVDEQKRLSNDKLATRPDVIKLKISDNYNTVIRFIIILTRYSFTWKVTFNNLARYVNWQPPKNWKYTLFATSKSEVNL